MIHQRGHFLALEYSKQSKAHLRGKSCNQVGTLSWVVNTRHNYTVLHTVVICNKRFRVYAKTMDNIGLITARQKQPATSSVCLALSQN